MSDYHNQDTPWFPTDEDAFARHFGPSPPRVHARFGALSHPGLVRRNNEDHYVVVERHRGRVVLMTNLPEGVLRSTNDTAYLLAVADGIGGKAFGELASMLALHSGYEQATNAFKWTWIVTDSEIANLKERVGLVFQQVHEELLEQARQQPAYIGMGTTLTAAYTVGPEAFIAHVGDSRAYLFHGAILTRLTRDHTKAQDALDAGVPVASRSWYRTLTNCLGVEGQQLWVDFHHLQLADGDQLLLCTDGLTELVSDEEIAQVLSRGAPAQEAVQALVDLALAHGGHDNITVILAQYQM
jgi:serine/threonine protein phosphatase PrpC